MSVISGANLIIISDGMSKQKIILDTAVGTTTTASTILKGMQDNADRIVALDEDVNADLFKSSVGVKNEMPQVKLRLNQDLLRAIENHIRRLEDMGMSDYWEQENYPTNRWAPEVVQIGRGINLYFKPITVFPPVTAMGSFVADGATSGTFTDGSAIDVNLYGPGNCELEVTVVGGATVDLTATVTGTDEEGLVVTGTATFSGATVGTTQDVVPDQAGKKFQDITNITVIGATATDAFKIQSKVDRAVAL